MIKIIAYFLHDTERALAQKLMKNVQATESYLIGEVRKKDIATLEQAGLIVEKVAPSSQTETPGSAFLVMPGVQRKGEAARRSDEALPVTPVDPTQPNFYLITLQGPLLEERRRQLVELGVHLLEYIPTDTYTARLTPEQKSAIENLPFVSNIRIYDAADTGQPVIVSRKLGRPRQQQKMVTYDISLHRAEDMPVMLQWLAERRISIAGSSRRKVRVFLLENDLAANEIAALPAVAAINRYTPPQLHNDVARVLLGIDSAGQSSPAAALRQTGKGQIVAVADTGLDETHPDFRGRILRVVPRGREADASDPHGHGTHVSGSALGSGKASNGKMRGVAPQAQLFFQSLLDDEGALGGLPLDLGDMLQEAYDGGARIHNNSWGSATDSYYTPNSVEVDEFVAEHRDMLVVISAGNAGTAAAPEHSKRGFVDWLSISSPASAKNALTVSASRSSRTDGAYSSITYRDEWPERFPDPPIAAEHVSGNAEALAAFSSRGPCDDRRIKPDVVAPGTDIVSARSSLAPLRNFWGPYGGDGKYAYWGGTSMAAPLVSGCAALIRQYYVETRKHQPSAALLKATIINSTRRLSAPDALADHDGLPNFHQGFGCVHMPWAIPNKTQPQLKLVFVDTWHETQRQLSGTGKFVRFEFTCAGGDWLRLCLAWTDLPGRGLQNDLDLILQHAPPVGQKWSGNASLPLSLTKIDRDNNVESIRIDNPPAGKYLVQIVAKNILRGPQDFALIITGAIKGNLEQVI